MVSRTVTKLEGVADLKAALAGLADDVATKIGQRANNRAAKIGAAAVKAAAPVSDIPSGAKRSRRSKGGESVAFEHHKILDEIKVRMGRARKENVVVSNITTGRAFHALMVERGTKHSAAHPFMAPAIDQAAPAMQAAQIDELRKGIEANAKKARKRKG